MRVQRVRDSPPAVVSHPRHRRAGAALRGEGLPREGKSLGHEQRTRVCPYTTQPALTLVRQVHFARQYDTTPIGTIAQCVTYMIMGLEGD